MHYFILIISVFLIGSITAPIPSPYAVHEKRNALPSHWQRGEPLEENAVLPMRIALAQQNLGKAHEFLMSVSSPTSTRFGQHWSGSTVYQPETAAEEVIRSGGGFSNVFSLPDYQASAVHSYFANNPTSYTAQQFNNSQQTRGFPDVSANGVNFVIAIEGKFVLVYGTSASTPVVGAIVTILNGARLAVGKSPVGFMNPTLYAHPWIMNDITSGSNEGCGTFGFTSVTGWDPVTGLGTPNYPAWASLWLSLP
jgi:tripeptidyl-peptidase-1